LNVAKDSELEMPFYGNIYGSRRGQSVNEDSLFPNVDVAFIREDQDIIKEGGVMEMRHGKWQM
jgi:hypothetical protein